jgi:hypothetical protein
VATGEAWVTATDNATGLGHAGGYSDVDVIDLSHPCKLVRLYYLFGFQGDFKNLPPVTVPVGQVAVTDGGPWKLMSPASLTARIRGLLKRLSPSAPRYSLPYPSSYWHIFVAHTEAEGLSKGGVRCVQH